MSERRGGVTSERLAQLILYLMISLSGASLCYADTSELLVSLGSSYAQAIEEHPSRLGLGSQSLGGHVGVGLGVSPTLSLELSGGWREGAETHRAITQPLSEMHSSLLPCPLDTPCSSSALFLKTRRRVVQLSLHWQPYDHVSPLVWAGLGAWWHERREAYEVLSFEEGALRGASLPSAMWWGGLAQLGLGLSWRFHARLSLLVALSLSAQTALQQELGDLERLRVEGGLWLRYHRYVRLF